MKRPLAACLSVGMLLFLIGCISAEVPASTPSIQRETIIPAEPAQAVPSSTICPTADAVSGVVTDEQGRPIQNATVRVQATSQSRTTGAEGKFILCGVPKAGTFKLTAYRSGYIIQGVDATAGGTDIKIQLAAHAAEDNPDYVFLTAGVISKNGDANTGCAKCHSADSEESAQGITLPFDEWSLDAHAKSATNARFLSMYNGTDLQGNRSPLTTYITQKDYGLVPLPPTLDATYHGPGFKLDFPNSTGNCATCHMPAAAVNAPYDTDPNTVTGVGLEGVTCDFCHKVSGVSLDSNTGLPSLNMTGILSLDLLRPSGEEQLFLGPFDDVAPGSDTYSALQNTSQYCAACHSADFWDTKVYNSYGEWLDSPYSNRSGSKYKTCQDCHMPSLGMDHFARIENGGLIRAADTIFSHKMLGAFDQNLLQNTAEMQVTAKRDGKNILVNVSIYNANAGHDMPTDSPLRQIILSVKATDNNGNTVPLTIGPVLPGWTGDYANTPGIYFAKILEELWTGVSPTASYWMQTKLVEDTRLPALQTRTANFIFEYTGVSPITINASLVYRRAYYDILHEKGWNTPDILMGQKIIDLQ